MEDQNVFRDVVTMLAYVTNGLHDYDFLNGDRSILYMSPRILHVCAECLEQMFPPFKNDGSLTFSPKGTNFESFIKLNEK